MLGHNIKNQKKKKKIIFFKAFVEKNCISLVKLIINKII